MSLKKLNRVLGFLGTVIDKWQVLALNRLALNTILCIITACVLTSVKLPTLFVCIMQINIYSRNFCQYFANSFAILKLVL